MKFRTLYNSAYLLACLVFCFVGMLVASDVALAKQSKYSRKLNGEHYQFSYQWLDHRKQTQSLSFNVSAEQLSNSFRSFKTYKPTIANKVITRNVHKKLSQEDLVDVQVHYPSMVQPFDSTIKITGSDELKVQKAYKKLAKIQQQEVNRYYLKHFYRPHKDHFNNSGIKVDHARVAKATIKNVKPVSKLILEKVQIKDVRLVTNYILGFMQSIPYDTLESTSNSSGTGFNPPMRLLYENQGDCDSKMVLTVALLKAAMPGIKVVLIYIEQHVFIGINAIKMAGDKTVKHNNDLYVLADPTGPNVLPLGNIPTDLEIAIDQSAYVIEAYRD
ncbi:MAG: hypothetical protein ACPGTQ_00515 [Colwellia sp.]